MDTYGVPQHRAAVRYVETIEDTSPLSTLRLVQRMESPWELRTNEALLRGGRRFLAEVYRQQEKPHLPLKGFVAGFFAVPDIWNVLGPRKCIVIVDGQLLQGPVAVWRTPLMLPQDIEAWEAVDLPSPVDMRFLPDNCIICSCQGLGELALAGGDYDGDVVMVSTDPDLLRL